MSIENERQAFDALMAKWYSMPIEARETMLRHAVARLFDEAARNAERWAKFDAVGQQMHTQQNVAVNEWREALINELCNIHVYSLVHDADPRRALQDVIDWHCGVAIDPAVSSDAAALIERGIDVAIDRFTTAAKGLMPEDLIRMLATKMRIDPGEQAPL